MKTIALILARGGSKQIPKKNIINIKGKPLLHYTIKAAVNSKVQETWVGTDCEEIKNVAIENGAKVFKRPDRLCGDLIMPDESLVYFAKKHNFTNLVFIQPTSPLLKSKYINEGLKQIKNFDSVFSVHKEHWVPKWKTNKTPHEWNPKNRPRRQDKEELFVENGAFYISKKTSILTSNLRYSGNIGFVEMPFSESFQVDSMDDLKLISKLL